MEEKLKMLEKWVEDHYSPVKCGWTYERSEGHSYDCFDDGYESGTSNAAYTIGCILGMELEEPDEPECE